VDNDHGFVSPRRYGPLMTENTSETRRPGVAQTLSLMFDNEPTWGDLMWLVGKAEEAGINPDTKILFEYDDDDPHAGPTGISVISHPDTSGG
jgi:hypothetical protein